MEPSLWQWLRLERGVVCMRVSLDHVLVALAEKPDQYLARELVDLVVLVLLQPLNVVQSATLLDNIRVRVAVAI
jgi:hypothetical protein